MYTVSVNSQCTVSVKCIISVQSVYSQCEQSVCTVSVQSFTVSLQSVCVGNVYSQRAVGVQYIVSVQSVYSVPSVYSVVSAHVYSQCTVSVHRQCTVTVYNVQSVWTVSL